MKQFHHSLLVRLLIAGSILTALVAVGGHLVGAGRLSPLDGPHVGRRVTLIALFSGLATTACLYPLLANLHRRVFQFADDVVTGNLELASVMGAAIAQRDSDTGDHNFRAKALERYRHRYMRKGKYIYDRFGELGCIGCGRCVRACTANIANPREVFNTLWEASQHDD